MRPSNIIRDRYLYLQACELEALQQTVDELPPNSICLNIGAGFGTSGLTFIENGKVGRLITIDKYLNNADNGLGSLEFENNVFKEFGYHRDKRYWRVWMDSIEYGKSWNRPYKFDMIFLDGDHTYDHCHGDISVWLPHINTGGVFAFHDYHEPNWPGVTQAIDELLMNKHDVIRQAATFIAFRIRREDENSA